MSRADVQQEGAAEASAAEAQAAQARAEGIVETFAARHAAEIDSLRARAEADLARAQAQTAGAVDLAEARSGEVAHPLELFGGHQLRGPQLHLLAGEPRAGRLADI